MREPEGEVQLLRGQRLAIAREHAGFGARIGSGAGTPDSVGPSMAHHLAWTTENVL